MGPGKVAVWSKFCPSYALAINLAGDFSKHARQLLGQAVLLGDGASGEGKAGQGSIASIRRVKRVKEQLRGQDRILCSLFPASAVNYELNPRDIHRTSATNCGRIDKYSSHSLDEAQQDPGRQVACLFPGLQFIPSKRH